MTNIEFAKAIKHNVFATKESYDEAMEYAWSVAKGSNNSAAVMTAVQVVVNTIAKQMLENEKVDI
jgi:chorismate synthase